MASKLRDGLFIGDAETSTDPEFLELNKISNLVNLSGRDIPNVWAAHGLVYLTFLWEDNPDFRLFGNMEDCDAICGELYPPPLSEIVDFIDGSLRHGISVLLFSKKGQKVKERVFLSVSSFSLMNIFHVNNIKERVRWKK